MILMPAYVMAAIVPISVDLAAITPDRAARLVNQSVELRPVLGPRIGIFGDRLAHDHVSRDGTCRTVWTPAGEKIGRVLVGTVEVIEHTPQGQFPGFTEIRFAAR